MIILLFTQLKINILYNKNKKFILGSFLFTDSGIILKKLFNFAIQNF